MNLQFGREAGAIEVIARDRAVSDALIARAQELMDLRSVIRGQVITFGSDPYGRGMAGLTFVERPTVDAAAVVLPAGVLDRVAHHVIGMGEQRERLLAHGQHLKRGVLLYGPPGTGKTHTVRYLLSASPGTTAVLLSGGSLRFIHDAAKVARAHQPAIVVLEDCDLVAEDRSFGMGASPLLFEVLDALDGLDADADVAFVLTTNRVEDLEIALAQRPGRVDLAAEIPLPDGDGRRALLHLYGGHLFGAEAISAAAARAEGTTASFTKELVRRAVLAAAIADEPPSDDHLGAALDELLSDAHALTRSLLGVGAGGGPGAGGPGGRDGMFRGSAGRHPAAAPSGSRDARPGLPCLRPHERSDPPRLSRPDGIPTGFGLSARILLRLAEQPASLRARLRLAARLAQPAKARTGWPGTSTRTRKTAPASGSGSSRFSRDVVMKRSRASSPPSVHAVTSRTGSSISVSSCPVGE